ncbi:unnamed protein product [Arabis nemorensis]|uniref:Reverse transcriptase zinc-binding domain-containing protein n=1 Tax=Arabis nemorensis TaxID=586526 RepID=A0A565BW60_9BRAS|nr:unnamed protein product [Arabis nemorensis]
MLKHDTFWNTEPSSSASWLWKSLMALRPLAKRFLRSSIGDGQDTSFWYDHWLDLELIIEVVGPNGPSLMGINVSSTVADACCSTGWYLPTSRTRNLALTTLRTKLMETTPPNSSIGPNSYYWYTNSSSNIGFSSRQNWEQLRAMVESIAVQRLYFQARFPVRSRLALGGIDTPISCCICNQQAKTRDHLFLHCDFSSQVWAHVLRRKLG